ncbi:hypothetical protein G6F62_014921 [Rhizopus arrhizus]|nr:hypothetical protein G6F62_014921 [Rhizopus arrhizus]
MKRFPPAYAWQDWFLNVQRAFLLILAPWLVSVLAQFAGRAYLLATYAPPATYAARDEHRLFGLAAAGDAGRRQPVLARALAALDARRGRRPGRPVRGLDGGDGLLLRHVFAVDRHLRIWPD